MECDLLKTWERDVGICEGASILTITNANGTTGCAPDDNNREISRLTKAEYIPNS